MLGGSGCDLCEAVVTRLAARQPSCHVGNAAALAPTPVPQTVDKPESSGRPSLTALVSCRDSVKSSVLRSLPVGWTIWMMVLLCREVVGSLLAALACVPTQRRYARSA